MSMTVAYAKILGGMLPPGADEVLRKFGRENVADIPAETIGFLKEFKLIEQTKNLLNGELIWVLTADGKKVQKYL